MVLRIRYVRPVGEVKGTTAWTESGVGIPRRGVMVRVARFRRGEVERRVRLRDTVLPHGSNAMPVIGCTSQIVGIRLFKLCGPGRWPTA